MPDCSPRSRASQTIYLNQSHGRPTLKKGWLGVAPSQLLSPHTNPSALVAVIIMIVAMVTMLPVIRRPVVIVCSVIRVPTVRVIIATGIIPVISRIAVIAVPVCGVTESDSDSSDAD
jgi:hypothetical protein